MQLTRKILTLSLLVVLVSPAGLFAQRELGGERVGTSAFSFLKIMQGARAQGLGGAYTAMADDASSLFWNPAGLAQRDGQMDFSVGQVQWIADFDVYSAAVGLRLGAVHHLGISALALSTAPMEITTEYRPDGTGEYFNYGDVLLGITYAQRMTDRFSFGITTKVVEEQLADLYMRGYMFDLGTFYRTGFRDLNFGVAFLNFGQPARPEGDYVFTNVNGETDSTAYQEFAPPTIFRMGIAYEWLQSPIQSFTTSVQLNHPVDQSESRSIGAEYALRDMIFLRGGYIDNADAQTWSIGGGVKISGIQIDYSFTDMSELGGTQRFSLGWSW